MRDLAGRLKCEFIHLVENLEREAAILVGRSHVQTVGKMAHNKIHKMRNAFHVALDRVCVAMSMKSMKRIGG